MKTYKVTGKGRSTTVKATNAVSAKLKAAGKFKDCKWYEFGATLKS